MGDREQGDGFSQWCLLEVKGHRQLAGLVTEEQIAGVWWLRVDVPGDEEHFVGYQYFTPFSIFSMAVSTEEAVRECVRRLGRRGESSMDPVAVWERERRRALGLHYEEGF